MIVLDVSNSVLCYPIHHSYIASNHSVFYVFMFFLQNVAVKFEVTIIFSAKM